MRPLRSLVAISWTAIWLAAGIGPGFAGDGGAWHERPHVALRLSAAALDDVLDGAFWAALELRLEPGWKIYWRSPGDAGVPTTIDWAGSENVEAVETHWPRPKRTRIWNVDTVGYGGEVAFPAALRLVDPKRVTLLRARITYGVCREICIPDEATLTLAVPPEAWMASAPAGRIRAALARVPDRGNAAALRIHRVALHGDGLRVEVESAAPLVAPDLFVEGPAGARFGMAETIATVGQAQGWVSFDVPAEGLVGVTWPLVLTFVDGPRAFERRVTAPFP